MMQASWREYGEYFESTNSRFIDGGTLDRSSGDKCGGVDDGTVGASELLKLALVNIKAGKLGTTSSNIWRCRGWIREAGGGERSLPHSSNHSLSGKNCSCGFENNYEAGSIEVIEVKHGAKHDVLA